ncbi:LysM peptidoglycan-binding domain-containing protein [Candidatus Nesciobacter abundans]|uniref:LysM peptidoglycan-binding domain-containing M23 family metallopeptidase n=1 Tax=Candidatus Nesciobacter abundans TaxID=2601668 RepID=A0A5C0UIF4_9PROT|nr:LysM peptidoglycan-binding domain-containing protein [Candidatus Nesciobacter abundans]QEK39192.1 LysM peptidoglycan-binding domain-containing M23 family metallopeptidase [Candidatus Nesciobacter abundans]
MSNKSAKNDICNIKMLKSRTLRIRSLSVFLLSIFLCSCNESEKVRRIYIVKENETIEEVSEKLNVSKKVLVDLNGIDNEYIQEGQVLRYTPKSSDENDLSLSDKNSDSVNKKNKFNSSKTSELDGKESNDSSKESEGSKALDMQSTDLNGKLNVTEESLKSHKDKNNNNILENESQNINKSDLGLLDEKKSKSKSTTLVERDSDLKASEDSKESVQKLKTPKNDNKKNKIEARLNIDSVNDLVSESELDKEISEEFKNFIPQKVKSKIVEKKKSAPKIVFPMKNGNIDSSAPFSTKHGNVREGVYILGSGDVVSSISGVIKFISKSEKDNNQKGVSGYNSGSTIFIEENRGSDQKYLIMYSGLESVFVRKGEILEKGSVIGSSKRKFFYRVWDGKQYINPSVIFA